VSPEKAFKSKAMKLPVGSQTWSVTGHKSASTMRLRPATEQSVNSVFAQLILEVGAEKVVSTATELGIETRVTPVPAIALGGLKTGVSPLEMANAYATLAAGGKRADVLSITSVEGPDGEVLSETRPKTAEAIDADVAYLTTDILKGVITKGTGKAAAIGRPAAGKTGTTQKYRDAWFVGYTPDIATAVWVGYADSQREMKSVHGRAVTGGSFPAEIWSRFMKAAHKDIDVHKFERPDGLKSIKVCAETGGTPTDFCPKTISALVLSGHEPGECEVHTKPIEVKVPKLVGLTKADALTKLEKLTLKAKVEEKNVPGVAAGIVAEQTPAAGTKVDTESTVTLIVSTGDAGDRPPVALFAAPAGMKPGQPVNFDGSGSTDDGTITTYYWEFGDGNTGSGKTATHTYEAPGPYEVTLWVTDDKGQQASVTHEIVVK
jgi:membrane peptidoglycan carboxypeptidase